MKNYTPAKLYEELSKTIMFQDEYLQTLATTLWLHDIRIKSFKYINPQKNTIPPKNNLLIVGPTGSGKTLALQTISKLLKYDLLITNFASFTGAGWKGRDVEEIIKDLYNICDRDIDRTERGIIFLDEIDKVVESLEEHVASTFSVVNSLLKIVESDIVDVGDDVKIKTDNILFIAAGAFEGVEKIIKKRISGGKGIGFIADVRPKDEHDPDIYLQVSREDLIEYGMNPQLIGRFSSLTSLHELHEEEIEQILLYSKASAVFGINNLIRNYTGVKVQMDEKGAHAVAAQAVKEKTGARGANSIIQSVMEDVYFLYEAWKDDTSIILITATSDGEPAIQTIEGHPEIPFRKCTFDLESISFPKYCHVHEAEICADKIMESDRNYCEGLAIKVIRAVHLLLTSCILYLQTNCSESDNNLLSLRKIVKEARKNSSGESVCNMLFDKAIPGNYTQIYENYKSVGVGNSAVDAALHLIDSFAEKQPQWF